MCRKFRELITKSSPKNIWNFPYSRKRSLDAAVQTGLPRLTPSEQQLHHALRGYLGMKLRTTNRPQL